MGNEMWVEVPTSLHCAAAELLLNFAAQLLCSTLLHKFSALLNCTSSLLYFLHKFSALLCCATSLSPSPFPLWNPCSSTKEWNNITLAGFEPTIFSFTTSPLNHLANLTQWYMFVFQKLIRWDIFLKPENEPFFLTFQSSDKGNKTVRRYLAWFRDGKPLSI